MKYLDKHGKAHSSRLKAIGADIKIAMKPKPPKQMECSPDKDKFVDADVIVPGQYPRAIQTIDPPIPVHNVTTIYETINQNVAIEEIQGLAMNAYSCHHITIDYEAAEIIAYGANGEIISKTKIDDRLLWGYAREALETVLAVYPTEGGKIIDLFDDAAKLSSESIDKAVAAAAGKNCIISPQVDDEFIECCADVVNNALKLGPQLIRATGKEGIRAILQSTENKINWSLAPRESEEPEG